MMMASAGIHILGFKPTGQLKPYHNLREPTFIYPTDRSLQGSTTAFIALHDAMLQVSCKTALLLGHVMQLDMVWRRCLVLGSLAGVCSVCDCRRTASPWPVLSRAATRRWWRCCRRWRRSLRRYAIRKPGMQLNDVLRSCRSAEPMADTVHLPSHAASMC